MSPPRAGSGRFSLFLGNIPFCEHPHHLMARRPRSAARITICGICSLKGTIPLKKVQPFSGNSLFILVQSLGWHRGYVTATKVFGARWHTVERQFEGLDLAKYRS